MRKYPGDWELYDMVEDRTELDDLSEKNKAQVAKMVAMQAEWVGRCGILPWEDIIARMRGG